MKKDYRSLNKLHHRRY